MHELYNADIFLQVECMGQTIGAIVAVDRRTATVASYKVVVKYEELKPVIVTIQVYFYYFTTEISCDHNLLVCKKLQENFLKCNIIIQQVVLRTDNYN